MIPVISSPCEAAREQADACHHAPRSGAGDAGLEILGKATVASEPSEGAFDDPSSRLWLEGPEGLGSGDDLDRPPAQLGDCVQQLWSAIDAIGEDVAQFGEHSSDGPQQWPRTVIILDIGGLDEDGAYRAFGIGDNMALGALHLLANADSQCHYAVLRCSAHHVHD